MLKVTKAKTTTRDTPADSAVLAQIQSSLQALAQSANQIRRHEELLRAAGVRVDRAGAALLYKLRLHAERPQRVTSLAALLGVDAPTVTRKVQQLEQLGYVIREPDPDDRRASLIRLTRAGQRTVERILSAHREQLAQIFTDWADEDVRAFATLLDKFSQSLRHNSESTNDH